MHLPASFLFARYLPSGADSVLGGSRWMSMRPSSGRRSRSSAIRAIIGEAVRLGREKGAISLRIDTDRSNPIMLHLLPKLGFIHTGHVLFAGDAKPAYELPFGSS